VEGRRNFCYCLLHVSETAVVTKTRWSRRAIIIAAVLFLLIVSVVDSQTPSPFQTPRTRLDREILDHYSIAASPTPKITRPPIPRRTTPVITPSPANQPTLSVSPSTRVEVGQRIWFKVFPQLPSDLGVQYNFDFGDRSANVQTNDPQTPYAYNSSGWYQASVEIRMRGGRLSLPKIFGPVVQVFSPSSPSPVTTVTSAPISPSPPSHYSATPTATATATATATRTPTATATATAILTPTATATATRTPTATPTATTMRTPFVPRGRSWGDKISWIHYIVSTGLAAAALYGILMLIKPTFRLHWNRDEPQMPLENVTINYELHFDSNISAGQDRLDVPGANLILAKRTQ
jgi:hypothetical protein